MSEFKIYRLIFGHANVLFYYLFFCLFLFSLMSSVIFSMIALNAMVVDIPDPRNLSLGHHARSHFYGHAGKTGLTCSLTCLCQVTAGI